MLQKFTVQVNAKSVYNPNPSLIGEGFFMLKNIKICDILFYRGVFMKKKLVAVGAVILAIALLLGIYFTFGVNSSKGSKLVTIEVVSPDGASTIYVVQTNAEYLRQVMDETDGLTYETNDGMVMVVNGVRADYILDGAYWAFYVNDGYCNYGIADQPVNDKDNFRIQYTKA